MRSVRFIWMGISALLLAAVGFVAFNYGSQMASWFSASDVGKNTDLANGGGQVIAANEQVRLTPQARRNLKLVSKPLVSQTFWRTIEIPGVIVDRPGVSDRGVVAPITGVVIKVHAFPGDTVEPGDVLVTLRLVSESLHTSQMEFFKANREVQITQEKKKRLSAVGDSGAIAQSRIIELDNELRRLEVVVQAYRQDLQIRGLTPPQVDGIGQGEFLSEVQVKAPARGAVAQAQASEGPASGDNQSEEPFRFEVQELKVELGQQIQAGQALCLLSDHSLLLIEGRCFHKELALVQQATKEGWPLEVEFIEESTSAWQPLDQTLRVQHVANTVDTMSRTLPFYVQLTNQRQSYERDGKQLLLWRFRPGQRVRFRIPVERFDDVFALPLDAVAREGPEAYVFRQNGEFFDRKNVHVLFEDRNHAIVANDGSVSPGLFVAQSGAIQLNRAMKAQGGEGPKGFHVHADGSVHANN